MSAISCATKLPIEKPSRSTRCKLHRLDEGDRVVGHRLDRVRRRAGRGADADVVERDHASIRGERVDERGIPVVEVAAEVLQQDERHLAFTEVAVRVLDRVVGRDSLRRGVGVARLAACRSVTVIDVPSLRVVSGRPRRRPPRPPSRSRSATSAGWETIATWLDGISTVVAPIRAANCRSASGGIASSFCATRYQDGSDFHAGSPMTSVKADDASGCWTAYMHSCAGRVDVGGEVVDEVVLGEPAEAARVGEQMRERRRDRSLREQRAERLALVEARTRRCRRGRRRSARRCRAR